MSYFLMPTGIICPSQGKVGGYVFLASGLITLHDDGNRVALAAIGFLRGTAPVDRYFEITSAVDHGDEFPLRLVRIGGGDGINLIVADINP